MVVFIEIYDFLLLRFGNDSVNFINMMETGNYPIPHSHKTFDFGPVTIDSNFDSGNLYNAEKINNTNVLIDLFSTTSGLLSIISRINIVHGFTLTSKDSAKVLLSLLILKICKIK